MPSVETEARRIADAYQPARTGRPSELSDPKVIRDFLKAVRAGNYLETACRVSGLGISTVHHWFKDAETEPDQNHPKVRFRQAYEKALASSEAEAVERVRRAGKAGPQYWTADMTYLERRYPDRWGKRPETYAGPAVTVILGAQAEHLVQVANPVNVIPYYQTQTESESLSSQSLAASENLAIKAKVDSESGS